MTLAGLRSPSAAALRRSLLAAVAVLAATGFPEVLRAQDTTASSSRSPYSSVIIGLSGTDQASSGRLGDYWDAGTGIRLDVSMPFHVGEAGVTVTTLRYRNRGPDQPAFRAIVAGARWRFPVGGSRRLRPAPALEAGNFMTIFDGEQPKGLGKESEVYVGAGADLDIRLLSNTSLAFGAEVRHVFTSTPIRLASVRAGVAHAFTTPGWLRAVIE